MLTLSFLASLLPLCLASHGFNPHGDLSAGYSKFGNVQYPHNPHHHPHHYDVPYGYRHGHVAPHPPPHYVGHGKGYKGHLSGRILPFGHIDTHTAIGLGLVPSLGIHQPVGSGIAAVHGGPAHFAHLGVETNHDYGNYPIYDSSPPGFLSTGCSFHPDRGYCNAAFPRWFFDPYTGTCQLFLWSGCGGNLNKYTSKIACLSTCAHLYHAAHAIHIH